jgi:hypothetical protein
MEVQCFKCDEYFDIDGEDDGLGELNGICPFCGADGDHQVTDCED